MVNWKSKKLGDFLWLANALAMIVIVNVLATHYFFRIDLTEEKRYSIKDQTKELLNSLEEDVFIEVYLEGELNAPFRRLQKNIEETLEEFRIYSGNKIRFTFTDPGAAAGQKARAEFMNDLNSRGIQPTNVVDNKNGQRVEKIIFPGAIISYGGFETGVMLLKGNKGATSDQRINQSIEGIEFELANAIYKLANSARKKIGFVRGHSEVDSLAIASFNNDLLELYDVFKVDLTRSADLAKYDVLVIAKPKRSYSALEKFRLDQFIMNGGKGLFLVDKLDASMDSATRGDYFALPYEHNLDDLLFRYGVRINADLVQDQQSAPYPVVTGQVGGKPDVELMEWPFYPMVSTYPEHPVTRNLDAITLKFVSSIDTVKAPGVKKTPLLMTSPYSQVIGAPVQISINDLRRIDPAKFTAGNVPLSFLLEGNFTSLFKNRFLPEGADSSAFKSDGTDTKIIVVSDGDIIRNEINPRTRQPQELGFDPFTNLKFANRDFLLNSIAYLVEENGLIQARSKEVKLRPLDRTRITGEKTKWQIFNLVLPLVLMVIYGIIRSVIRKRKYARF